MSLLILLATVVIAHGIITVTILLQLARIQLLQIYLDMRLYQDQYLAVSGKTKPKNLILSTLQRSELGHLPSS